MEFYTKKAKAVLLFLIGVLFLFFFSCMKQSKKTGVVRFHDKIPPQCRTTRGLKQQKVVPVYSEEQLRKHYGLTFQIRFNDGKSPRLYGALYYQNPKKNLYCAALPNGRFAVFSDSKIGKYRKNIIQEVCYPIQECRGL